MPSLTGQTLVALIESSGFEPSSYSGGGMYGKECVSVRGVRGDVTPWDVAWNLAMTVQDEHEGSIYIPEPRIDSLGLGVIIYWPSVEWPKETGNDNAEGGNG